MSNESHPDRNWCNFVRCRLFGWFIIFFSEVLNKSKGNISEESNFHKILDDVILDVICFHDVIVSCERFGRCEALVPNKWNLTAILIALYRILFTFSIQSLLLNSLFTMTNMFQMSHILYYCSPSFSSVQYNCLEFCTEISDIQWGIK